MSLAALLGSPLSSAPPRRSGSAASLASSLFGTAAAAAAPVFSAAHSLARLLALRGALLSAARPSEALVLVGGIDGDHNDGSRMALNYLLAGLSGPHLASLRLADADLDDVVVVLHHDRCALYCSHTAVAKLRAITAMWPALTLFTPHAKFADQDTDWAQEHKIRAFVQMVEGVESVLAPLAALAALVRSDSPAVDDARTLLAPLAPGDAAHSSIEQWPLVQAYALQEVGAGIFFTLKHAIVDCAVAVHALVHRVDAHGVAYMLNDCGPRWTRHYQDTLINLAHEVPGPTPKREAPQETLMGEPVVSHFAHGLSNGGIRPFANAPVARVLALPPPKAALTLASRAGAANLERGIAAQIDATDALWPMTTSRVAFLAEGHLVEDYPFELEAVVERNHVETPHHPEPTRFAMMAYSVLAMTCRGLARAIARDPKLAASAQRSAVGLAEQYSRLFSWPAAPSWSHALSASVAATDFSLRPVPLDVLGRRPAFVCVRVELPNLFDLNASCGHPMSLAFADTFAMAPVPAGASEVLLCLTASQSESLVIAADRAESERRNKLVKIFDSFTGLRRRHHVMGRMLAAPFTARLRLLTNGALDGDVPTLDAPGPLRQRHDESELPLALRISPEVQVYAFETGLALFCAHAQPVIVSFKDVVQVLLNRSSGDQDGVSIGFVVNPDRSPAFWHVLDAASVPYAFQVHADRFSGSFKTFSSAVLPAWIAHFDSASAPVRTCNLATAARIPVGAVTLPSSVAAPLRASAAGVRPVAASAMAKPVGSAVVVIGAAGSGARRVAVQLAADSMPLVHAPVSGAIDAAALQAAVSRATTPVIVHAAPTASVAQAIDELRRANVAVHSVCACIAADTWANGAFPAGLLAQAAAGYAGAIVLSGVEQVEDSVVAAAEAVLRATNPLASLQRGVNLALLRQVLIASPREFDAEQMREYRALTVAHAALDAARFATLQARTLAMPLPLDLRRFARGVGALNERCAPKVDFTAVAQQPRVIAASGVVRAAGAESGDGLVGFELSASGATLDTWPVDARASCTLSLLGVGLSGPQLHELVLSAVPEVTVPRERTIADLSEAELLAIDQEHSDNLPEGWFFNGRHYVALSGASSFEHPLRAELVAAFLARSNAGVREQAASLRDAARAYAEARSAFERQL